MKPVRFGNALDPGTRSKLATSLSEVGREVALPARYPYFLVLTIPSDRVGSQTSLETKPEMRELADRVIERLLRRQALYPDLQSSYVHPGPGNLRRA